MTSWPDSRARSAAGSSGVLRRRRLRPRYGEKVVTALGRCVDPATVDMITFPGVGSCPAPRRACGRRCAAVRVPARLLTSATSPAHRPAAVAGVLSVVLAVGYLFWVPPVPDLAAQTARADTAGAAIYWTGWFGGVHTPGYSVLVPPLMHLLSVSFVGAVATVVAAVLFPGLLRGALRPTLAAIAFTLLLVTNLLAGRITFAVGVALALGGLRLLAARRGLVGGAAGRAERAGEPGRRALSRASSPPCWCCSPRAGGARRSGSGSPRPSRCILVAVLFPDPGRMPFTRDALKPSLYASLGLIPSLYGRRARLARWGAVASLVLVLGAYLVTSPIGSNAERFALLWGLPMLLAYSPLPAFAVVLVAFPLVWWAERNVGAGAAPLRRCQRVALVLHAADHRTREALGRHPPGRGDRPAYPLVVRVRRGEDPDRARVGAPGRRRPQPDLLRPGAPRRRELPPVPRPVRGRLGRAARTPSSTSPRRPKRAWCARASDYLTPVWHGGAWTLYAVSHPAPLVSGTLTATSVGRSSVHLERPEAGASGVLQLHWSRWLAASNGCLRKQGEWTYVQAKQAGPVKVCGQPAYADRGFGLCKGGRICRRVISRAIRIPPRHATTPPTASRK